MPVVNKILTIATSLLALAVSAFADNPSLFVGQYPKSVFLGDSFTLEIALQNFDGSDAQPKFANQSAAAEIEFLNSYDSRRQYESWVNGKRTSRVDLNRTFAYRVTPSKGGKFSTGEISVTCGKSVLTSPGCIVSVIAPQTFSDIFCKLDCNFNSVLVDSPFKIVFTLYVSALPTPFEEMEPIVAKSPLNISSSYLNFEEVAGLSVPSVDDALSPLLSQKSSKTPFTINKYIVQEFFSSYARRFYLDTTHTLINGTNYWTYSLPVEYTATEVGDYTFGPVYVKGEIPVLIDERGAYRPKQVFIASEPITVKVTPPPEEGRPSCFIGAVGSKMDVKASLDAEQCKVGDPLSLTIDVTGDINTRSVFSPDISAQLGKQDDFKIYDDNVESLSIPNGKQFKYRVRPLRAGTFEFPAIKAAFFNAQQGDYFTVETEPMPLQVEATTQIAATSDDSLAEGKAEDKTLPDGIIMNREDRQPLAFTLLGDHTFHLLLAAPLALFLIAAAAKFSVAKIRHVLSTTRHGRNASGAFRELGDAIAAARKGEAEAGPRALRAARACIASLLGNDAASVTEPDIVNGLSARGVPAEDAETAGRLFSDLENSVYSRTSDSHDLADKISALQAVIAKARAGIRSGRHHRPSTSSALLLLAALSALALAPAKTTAAINTDFEWERANRLMFSAQTEADYLDAAKQYCGIVTNGVVSGPLYYNLGTALILAGKPQAAIESLKEAELYLGTAREVADNWRAANAKISQSNGEIPVSRTFLCWHYGLDLAARTDIAVICWTIFFVFATLLLFIPKTPRLAAVAALRKTCLVIIWISAIGALFYGTTALLYHSQKNSAFHNLPGVELSLAPPTVDTATEASK